MVDGMRATLYPGPELLEVVGESNYQDHLWAIVGCEPSDEHVRHHCAAILVPESDNSYDSNAIAVWVDGLLVGYLSRGDAAEYRSGLLKLAKGGPVALPGTIAGGGHGGRPMLGVFLDHDPTDFGLEPGLTPSRDLRTGLTWAVETDEADDTYDLHWLDELPGDTHEAVARLREFLEHEADPIDRHFMFRELESRLYRLRHMEEQALQEYDDACRTHDTEMDQIRPALIEKFEKLPLLETYKQQGIRQQKAKSWAEGLRWVERGLSLYGDDALREDWVEDLRKRATHFRAKLDPAPTPPPPPKRAAVVPRLAETETLTCSRCGSTWERVRTTGRKPLLCDACRAAN
jgi:hypothetical protein